MRKYNHDTDFSLLVEAAKKEGVSIAAAARALQANGIHWPALQDSHGRSTPEQNAMDKELSAAWKEAGLMDAEGRIVK